MASDTRALSRTWTAAQRQNFHERLLQEVKWREYANDVELFISECVKITVADGSATMGKKPFELYDYQLDALSDMKCNKFVLALKARQLGFTTLGCAYALWQLLFRPGGATIVFISKDQVSADKNLAMVKAMYHTVPEWVKKRGPSVVGDAVTKISFSHRNGTISELKSYPPTKNAAAGDTITFLMLDEFDLYDKTTPAEVWSVVEPALMSATSNTFDNSVICFIISTARNPDGVFARMYKAGKKAQGRFKTIFVSAENNRFLWTDGKFDITKLNQKREEAKLNGREYLIHREYPLTDTDAFLLSGATRYTNLPAADEITPYPHIGELTESGGKFHFQETQNGNLHINEMPKETNFYVLTVDPAHGIGKDYTVAQVLTFNDDGDPQLCAVWFSNTIEQAQAAGYLADLGRFYAGNRDEALLVWDRTGNHSDLLVHKWRDEYQYRNMYRYLPASQARRRRPQPVYGFDTGGTGGKRNLALDTLQEFLPRLDGIYFELLDELQTFVVRENGRAEAEHGCHDDHIMALAQGLWVLQEKYSQTIVTGNRDLKSSKSDPWNINELFETAAKKHRAFERQDRKAGKRLTSALRRRR